MKKIQVSAPRTRIAVFPENGRKKNTVYKATEVTLTEAGGRAFLEAYGDPGSGSVTIVLPKKAMTKLCLDWLCASKIANPIKDATRVITEMLDATGLQCNCPDDGCDGSCTYSEAMALLSELKK